MYKYTINYRYKKENQIINKADGLIYWDIIGKNNVIEINEHCHLVGLLIRIRGDYNKLVINNNCVFGPDNSIWMEGEGCSVTIGANTTATRLLHINAQEDGSKIEIGEDCMFSNHIIIRTSDSHPIFDLKSGERINKPKNIRIGNHVWVAPNTKIMKGAIIEDNCIIGSDTTVSHHVSSNSLYVGRPGKVVKDNIYWTREKLF